MNLHIIAIGKKKSEYDTMIAEYQKRIVAPFSLTFEILEPSGLESREASQKEETLKILTRIKSSDEVIIFDEHGKDLATIAYAELLEKKLIAGTKRVVFIIGGSYGLDLTLLPVTALRLRLGSLTLPHELVRIIITEQLYRVTNYLSGGKYHHI